VINITKYKGVIRLNTKPYNIIKWFTKNYKHEIGAVGIGEIKDGEIVVEKLVFPNQIVNGSHVHFKPEDWGTIAKELTQQELEKVIFYWHKHPDGVPGASQGDEDDTFDVFMGEESGRKMFGFLQTANSTTGQGFIYEGRIEMREPIWASITDVELQTDKDDKIEKACEKIIKAKITEGYASATDQPGTTTTTPVPPVETCIPKKTVAFNANGKDLSYKAYKEGKFQCFCFGCGLEIWKLSEKEYEDGATCGWYCKKCSKTLLSEKSEKETLETHLKPADYGAIFEVSIENGNVKLKHSEFFGEWIDEIMENPDVGDLVNKTSTIPGDITTRNLQPKKKQMNQLYNRLKSVENELFDLGTHGDIHGWYDKKEAKEAEEEEDEVSETKSFNKGFSRDSQGFYGG